MSRAQSPVRAVFLHTEGEKEVEEFIRNLHSERARHS